MSGSLREPVPFPVAQDQLIVTYKVIEDSTAQKSTAYGQHRILPYNKRFTARVLATVVTGLLLLMAVYDYSAGPIFGRLIAPALNKKPLVEVTNKPGAKGSAQCQEKRHFAFLKVPKAGSSTVQNIFYRFGTLRWLTFVLPVYNNYVGRSRVIDDKALIPLPSDKKNYDIMCNHVPYSHSEFSRLLPNDTVYIGIIREPMPHLESFLYFYYYNQIGNPDKLTGFLQDPDYYIYSKHIKPNPQTDYYGLPESDVTNVPAIRNFIDKISREFDFIIILERLHESLLVMKRKYCWKITDILYIRKNTNSLNPHLGLSHPRRSLHRGLALAEYMFYKHFQIKLIKEIVDGGSDFQQELDFYRTTLRSVTSFCLDKGRRWADKFYIAESKWNPATNVSAAVCSLMMMPEMKLQDVVGQRQYGKEAWARLHVTDTPSMRNARLVGDHETKMNITLPNGRRVQKRYFNVKDQAKFERALLPN